MNKTPYIIALYIFFFSTGGYMAMPLFPSLTGLPGITIIQTSILTALYVFFQMCIPILSGQLGDRYGYRNIVVLGEFLRGISFLFIGMVDQYTLLVLFTSLGGLGGGISTPSLQSLMMSSGAKNDYPKLSSLRVTALNAGLICGPVIAGLVISSGHIHLIFITAGSFYMICSILLFFTVNTSKRITEIKPTLNFKNIFLALSNKSFQKLLVIMILFYMIFAQLFVAFPEHSKGFTSQVQSTFLTYGIVGLIFQYPLGILMNRLNFKAVLYMIIGTLFLIISFFILIISDQYFTFYVAIILFSLGPAFTVPSFENLVAKHSHVEGKMGLYFGISRLSDGIGRPIGSLAGGWMFYTFGSNIFWHIFLLFSCTLLLMFIVNIKSLMKIE